RLVHLPRGEIARRTGRLLERLQLPAGAERPGRAYPGRGGSPVGPVRRAPPRPARPPPGGMRRRVDLAAALVNRPPVLFLDEPTTGLDPYSRNEVWAMIGELVDDGTTVVLTTQYLEEADRLASRVAVVDQGRVIADDAPARLKARLGSTVIEIGPAAASSASRARDVLARAGTPAPELEDSTVRLTAHEGARLLVDALRGPAGGGDVPGP